MSSVLFFAENITKEYWVYSQGFFGACLHGMYPEAAHRPPAGHLKPRKVLPEKTPAFLKDFP